MMNDGERPQASPFIINEHRWGSSTTDPKFTCNIRLTIPKYEVENYYYIIANHGSTVKNGIIPMINL
jgi:hypothetical protein